MEMSRHILSYIQTFKIIWHKEGKSEILLCNSDLVQGSDEQLAVLHPSLGSCWRALIRSRGSTLRLGPREGEPPWFSVVSYGVLWFSSEFVVTLSFCCPMGQWEKSGGGAMGSGFFATHHNDWAIFILPSNWLVSDPLQLGLPTSLESSCFNWGLKFRIFFPKMHECQIIKSYT